MTLAERNFLLSLYSFSNLSDKEKIRRIYIMTNNNYKYYYKFSIQKKKGYRIIYSPYKNLKLIQKNILDILYEKRLSPYVKSYRKNYSLKDNASIHTKHKYILKLDIKHFFDNISYTDIYNIFNEYGFSKSITSVLAHLCTYNEFLPQGSVTAPYLSNLYLREFDYIIGEYCQKKNINYTRYSDDLTFSMDKYDKDLIRFVRVNLYKYGLELNNKKIHLISNSSRQIVTGLVVNDKISVSKSYKRKIRQEVYYINKYSLTSHLERLGINDSKKYIKSLYGKILFVLSIENSLEFYKYQKIIKKLL